MQQSTLGSTPLLPSGFSWNAHDRSGSLLFRRGSGVDSADRALLSEKLGMHAARVVQRLHNQASPCVGIVVLGPGEPGDPTVNEDGEVIAPPATCLLAIGSTVLQRASLYVIYPDGTYAQCASLVLRGGSWMVSRDGTEHVLTLGWWDFESSLALALLSGIWNRLEATSGVLSPGLGLPNATPQEVA